MVGPSSVILSIREGLGWHERYGSQLTLISVSELMSHNQCRQVEYQKEMVTEDSDHARFVEPAAKDEKCSVDAHQNKSPARQGIDYGPLTTFLLAIHVTSFVDLSL